MYEWGQGVPRDVEKAFQYYEEARKCGCTYGRRPWWGWELFVFLMCVCFGVIGTGILWTAMTRDFCWA